MCAFTPVCSRYFAFARAHAYAYTRMYVRTYVRVTRIRDLMNENA